MFSRSVPYVRDGDYVYLAGRLPAEVEQTRIERGRAGGTVLVEGERFRCLLIDKKKKKQKDNTKVQKSIKSLISRKIRPAAY